MKVAIVIGTYIRCIYNCNSVVQLIIAIIKVNVELKLLHYPDKIINRALNKLMKNNVRYYHLWKVLHVIINKMLTVKRI